MIAFRSLCVFCFVLGLVTSGMGQDDRWWPEQKLPKTILRTAEPTELPQPHDAYQVLLQSIAGLAAQSVNAGTSDSLVWVSTGSPEIERWYAATLARHPALKAETIRDPWQLIRQLQQRAVVKGYVLYRRDSSAGETNDHRKGMDCSINVATSLSGILGAVMIEENLEADARAQGLSSLADARDKSQAWCFATYKDQFSRHLLCCQDPRKPHVRDLAIAHRALTLFGDDPPLEEALNWLEPLSPILGWNGGDEFKTTRLSTYYGHIQTATDWCMNLPVLMAGSSQTEIPRPPAFDASQINWSDQRSGVCFIDTDGDNVQWAEGNFFGSTSYWSSPDRGKYPFGWSCCFTELAQLCPVAIEHAVKTRTPNDSFVEWGGGGYYYPDLFGMNRTNRWELLAHHARRTWALMKRTGTNIIGFNVAQLESPDALRSYQTFAGETDGLLAILVFQYAPYEAGAGKIWWVKDRRGIEIPVISARYSIWEHVNNKSRPLAGTPAKVARVIEERVASDQSTKHSEFDWVITHVWSYFRQAAGKDEQAEEMPQADAEAHGGIRGLVPVTWCIERLSKDIRVLSPDEYIWRLRMRDRSEQTKRLLKQ